jgi:alginate O-acetyltransferase complex protein AlgI
MLFGSQPFVLVFLPLTLGAWALLRGRAPRLALPLLIGASLIFYAWWRAAMVLLLAGSVVGNYAVGQRIRGLAGTGQD